MSADRQVTAEIVRTLRNELSRHVGQILNYEFITTLAAELSSKLREQFTFDQLDFEPGAPAGVYHLMFRALLIRVDLELTEALVVERANNIAATLTLSFDADFTDDETQPMVMSFPRARA